jgi:hypothetical protein
MGVCIHACMRISNINDKDENNNTENNARQLII